MTSKSRVCIHRSTPRVQLLRAQRFRLLLPVSPGDAREMYSVSIISFRAEPGPPPMCLMFNKSHNIIKHFQSRCFVIKSAGLTVPRIVSILSSWFCSFCCSSKVLCLHVFDGTASAAETQPASSCSIRPDSYVNLVSKLSCSVLTRTAYHAAVF